MPGWRWAEISAAKERTKKRYRFQGKNHCRKDEMNIKTSQMDYTVKYDTSHLFSGLPCDSDRSFLNPFFFTNQVSEIYRRKRIGLINEYKHLKTIFSH
jgi:hypothetical protein